MKGRPWTRNELLRALKLYCELPFGQMHSKNPSIQALALQLNRTASSIALKLVNFASLDKAHLSRGVAGMGNSSKLDREIWNEVQANWNLMIDLPISPSPTINIEEPEWKGETSATAVIKARRGQQFFRACVLSAYNFECGVTGIRDSSLLRASHIIPWHKQEKTRVDPRNGICLNALHDAAFDTGLVTFDKELRLVLSSRLKSEMPNLVFGQMFKTYEGKRLALPDRFVPPKEYLEFHRTTIFN
jgi:putative restriction endonuclease